MKYFPASASVVLMVSVGLVQEGCVSMYVCVCQSQRMCVFFRLSFMLAKRCFPKQPWFLFVFYFNCLYWGGPLASPPKNLSPEHHQRVTECPGTTKKKIAYLGAVDEMRVDFFWSLPLFGFVSVKEPPPPRWDGGSVSRRVSHGAVPPNGGTTGEWGPRLPHLASRGLLRSAESCAPAARLALLAQPAWYPEREGGGLGVGGPLREDLRVTHRGWTTVVPPPPIPQKSEKPSWRGFSLHQSCRSPKFASQHPSLQSRGHLALLGTGEWWWWGVLGGIKF